MSFRQKCFIVATSIALASFFSSVSASASPTGETIKGVVGSAASAVTAATGTPPPSPPAAVPSVPTPTPPAKTPVPDGPGSVTLPSNPASRVPNPSNSVEDVRSEIVQMGDRAGNVANSVGKQTSSPSTTPVGDNPLAERGLPAATRASRRSGGRLSIKRAVVALQRWIAHVWPAVAFWRGMAQRTPREKSGDKRSSVDLFEIPRSSVGLTTSDNAHRPGWSPSVRSETLSSAPAAAPLSDWIAIIFCVMGMVALATITPWFRGTS
jgi:hypothetical protein